MELSYNDQNTLPGAISEHSFSPPAERGADHAGRHQGSPVGFGQSHCVLQATGG